MSGGGTIRRLDGQTNQDFEVGLYVASVVAIRAEIAKNPKRNWYFVLAKSG